MKMPPTPAPKDASATAEGTALPPGDAPAPPPHPDYAARFYPAAEMDRARDEMMREQGAQKLAFVMFNLAEYQPRRGRLEGYYDQRITQRIVLQPRVELNLAAQDVADSGIGAGLSTAEFGLRLRYEVERQFAPYVGASGCRGSAAPVPARVSHARLARRSAAVVSWRD